MNKGWETSTINESCDILDNYRIPLNSEQREKIPGNIPYYGANGVQGYINEYIFDEDLILIAEDGGNFEEFANRPIAYRISGKSWVNNHAHVLRAKKGYDQDFIFYSIVNKNILPHIKGGTRSKLNGSDLKTIEFQHPEWPKQRKIACILSTCDAVIEKTEAAIAKYRALKQGLMHDLFTRGIDLSTGRLRPKYEDAPELYKESELGWVPKEWEVKRLGDLTSKIGSGITPTGGSDVYQKTGVLFIRSQNVLSGKLSLENAAYISHKIDEKMAGSKVEPFDVLLNITGASIGRCAHFPKHLGTANVNQHVCIIRFPKASKAQAVFTSQFLNSPFGQRQIFRYNAGGNREGLNFHQLGSFDFPFVSPPEQAAISKKIEVFDQKLISEESALSKYRQLKAGLMQDLLTGKVEVSVGEENIKTRL